MRVSADGPKTSQTLEVGRGIAALIVVPCHKGALVGNEPGLWQQKSLTRWLDPIGVVILLAHITDIGAPIAVLSSTC